MTASTDSTHHNRLAGETSPYLLQHATNPVDWRPWGPEALAEARTTNRPILLSIGYAACHWCHVMTHESFENPKIAGLMNRLFVNIKVDREERPDIDQIYMAALHALGQPGGWPLTMFLAPDGEPFWGGAYFPPEARYGRAGFPDVLASVSRTFHEAPDRVASNRRALIDRLNRVAAAPADLDRPILDTIADRLLGVMDLSLGGTHGAPKFPQCSLLDLLWRSGIRTGDDAYLDTVVLSLTRMSEGGIYDHLAGGYSRYSVDDRWLVPHFEKMLYDNAQLIDLLGRAHGLTGNSLFQQRIAETIGWLSSEMLLPEGAFAASLDADSEGEEGRFYVWTKAEIDEVLGSASAAFCAAYDVTAAGNWEGHTILNRSAGLDRGAPFAADLYGPERAHLLQRRAGRVRPSLDDKILADWNGLMIAALARAAARFDRPDWLAMARTAYTFIRTTMTRGDRLSHSYRAGRHVFPGVATDYATMIAAALTLHETTGDAGPLADAQAWADALHRHHWDAATGGYFAAADDTEALIARLKSTADEATPSANGVMAENLTRLWLLTGDETYRDRADALLAGLSGKILGNPYACASLLAAFDTRLDPVQVVLIIPPDQDGTALQHEVAAAIGPRIIRSITADPGTLPDTHPAKGKPAIDGRPTAYICRGTTCSLPLTARIHVKQALAGL